MARIHTKTLKSNCALDYESGFAGSAGMTQEHHLGTTAFPLLKNISLGTPVMKKDGNTFSLEHPLPIPTAAVSSGSLPLCTPILFEEGPLNKALQHITCKKIPHKWTLLGAQSLSAGQLWTAERKTDIVQEGELVFGLLSHYSLFFLALISLEDLHVSVYSMSSTWQIISYSFSL